MEDRDEEVDGKAKLENGLSVEEDWTEEEVVEEEVDDTNGDGAGDEAGDGENDDVEEADVEDVTGTYIVSAFRETMDDDRILEHIEHDGLTIGFKYVQ